MKRGLNRNLGNKEGEKKTKYLSGISSQNWKGRRIMLFPAFTVPSVLYDSSLEVPIYFFGWISCWPMTPGLLGTRCGPGISFGRSEERWSVHDLLLLPADFIHIWLRWNDKGHPWPQQQGSSATLGQPRLASCPPMCKRKKVPHLVLNKWSTEACVACPLPCTRRAWGAKCIPVLQEA